MSRSSANRKEARRNKWGGGNFTGLQRAFLDSTLLKRLSPYACKLLLDLLSQYNGCNNGDLTVAWSVMQHYGWSGKSTLEKATKELLACKVLILARQGGRNRCSLYALSIFAVDECKGKLEEISRTEKPTNDWLQNELRLIGGLQNKKPAPLLGSKAA
ncbi:MAG TPA: hypothetical protein VFW49_01005 [Fluviicoccus sp.]|nr:hypothetical protein [Fluviicoccus sp.]